MNRRFQIAFLALGLGCLAGCVSRSPNLDAQFGSALNKAKEQQMVPAVSRSQDAAPTSREMDPRTQSYVKDSGASKGQSGGTGADTRSVGAQ